MVIYRKYWHKTSGNFNQKAEEGYWKFVKELKRQKDDGRLSMTTDDMFFYIRRYSYHIGFKKNLWDSKARTYYFKFWIKRAEKSGFIEYLKSGVGRWLLNDKLKDVY